jgi:membrane associated rhomboid family serine protease
MLLPVRTDRTLRRTPWVNYTLIALNVLIFLITQQQIESAQQQRIQIPSGASIEEAQRRAYEARVEAHPIVGWYLFTPSPSPHQFFTYQFLHAGAWHLLGNMLFLFVFGNGVEDRLGKGKYAALYLLGGAAAGAGECLVGGGSTVLGASGSVAAVTGAFLVLLPLTRITVIYVLIIIGAIEISAIWVIAFQVLSNVLQLGLGGGSVAYAAHLAGYGFGFGAALALLGAGVVSRERYDLLALYGRWHRGVALRGMARRGESPWQGDAPRSGPVAEGAPRRTSPEKEGEAQRLRQQLRRAYAQGDLARAASTYETLLTHEPGAVLEQNLQLAVANRLMQEGKAEGAGRAYEAYLETYPDGKDRPEVELMLAVLHARYLNRPRKAVEILERVRPRLTDPGHRELADRTLAACRG